MRPLGLGAPVNMHRSACISFMPSCSPARHCMHMQKDFCIQVIILHVTPTAGTDKLGALTQTVWGFPPSYLQSMTVSTIFWVLSLEKIEANRKIYLLIEKSRPTFSGDLAQLQCCSSAFNSWTKPAFGAQVSLLSARSGRQRKEKRSHPNCSPFLRKLVLLVS